MKKKLEETADQNSRLKQILFAAVLIGLLGFILLLILVYGVCDDEDQKENCDADILLWATIILFILSGILTIIVVTSGLIKHPKFMNMDQAIISEIKNYLKQENQKNPNIEWQVEDDLNLNASVFNLNLTLI
ncbi:hypothetical protein PPERSA_05964 [Pseudocohnilembus persalinus]|uniref:Uncharacterized protein n=1 Tax=Pseudocohnilembus persalinus TaxID=266149 RepID=A0A0V0R485_PSEPJ|nr:hypothetical protein PPERSA_05964 [Pseudocohnilembus persalinus]|eukprot:KRX09295.1 hypothetical protein PPERSA_05964 [Pseudocohnilembus persalinus]